VKVLNERGQHDIYMVFGHMKAGVTPAQAIGDLNSVGSYLKRLTQRRRLYDLFAGTPGLAGDLLGPGVTGFMTGMMLLSGLILLAACANLGSLFAARAAIVQGKWLCAWRLVRAAGAFYGECLLKLC